MPKGCREANTLLWQISIIRESPLTEINLQCLLKWFCAFNIMEKSNASLEIWNSKASPDGKASMIHHLHSAKSITFPRKQQQQPTNKEKGK